MTRAALKPLLRAALLLLLLLAIAGRAKAIVSGDRDYLPLAAKREYTALIPGARLVVIEDSGHATPIDQVERFNTVVLELLSGSDSE